MCFGFLQQLQWYLLGVKKQHLSMVSKRWLNIQKKCTYNGFFNGKSNENDIFHCAKLLDTLTVEWKQLVNESICESTEFFFFTH